MPNQFNMRCPKCLDDQRIDLRARVWVRLVEDGTDPDLAHNHDHNWDGDSICFCNNCNYLGAAVGFETDTGMNDED